MKYTKSEWERKVYLHKCECYLCGRSYAHLSPAHIIPPESGGTNLICNIATLCRSCSRIVDTNLPGFDSYLWERTSKINRVIVVSLYANPLHSGHLNMIRAARTLGDYLVVIVNSDKQVELKGSTKFMDEQERLYVVASLKDVDNVLLSQDEGRSVSKDLEFLQPHVFANGGDVTGPNCSESDICKKLNIKTVFGAGGEKSQGSSDLKKELIKRHEMDKWSRIGPKKIFGKENERCNF